MSLWSIYSYKFITSYGGYVKFRTSGTSPYMYKVTHRKPRTLHLYHSSKKILLDFTPSIICLNYFYTTQKHILQSFKGSELITRSWVHTSVFPLVHELVSLALSRLDSILPCLHREIPLFPLEQKTAILKYNNRSDD